MRVMCVSDSHLRTRTFTRRACLEGDAETGLMHAVRAIKRLRPDVVTWTGDILHCRAMEQPCGAMLKSAADACSLAGAPLLVIHGNHDQAGRLAVESHGAINLGTLDGGRPGSYTLDGVVFRGLPFDPSPERLHESLAGIGPCDVLLMHQMFGELCGGAPSHDLTAEDLPAHVRCAVSGHVHRGRVWTSSSGVVVVSPGATAHTDLAGMIEVRPSYAVLELEPGGPVKARIELLPGRQAGRVRVEAGEEAAMFDALRTMAEEEAFAANELPSVVIVERAAGTRRFDPAAFAPLIVLDKMDAALSGGDSPAVEGSADSMEKAVAMFAPGEGDARFRRLLLDMASAGPSGARAKAEELLDEACGAGQWEAAE